MNVVNDLSRDPYRRPSGVRGFARWLAFAVRHPRAFRVGWRPATNLVANRGFESSTAGWGG